MRTLCGSECSQWPGFSITDRAKLPQAFLSLHIDELTTQSAHEPGNWSFR